MNRMIQILIATLFAVSMNAQSNNRILYETRDKYLNNVLQREDSVAYIYPSTNTNSFDYVKMVWNIPSQNYVSDIKYVYSYNQQGNLVETAYYKWDGTVWGPQSKTTRSYNAQNILSQISSFNWSTNTWEETSRSTYINNSQGKK